MFMESNKWHFKTQSISSLLDISLLHVVFLSNFVNTPSSNASLSAEQRKESISYQYINLTTCVCAQSTVREVLVCPIIKRLSFQIRKCF